MVNLDDETREALRAMAYAAGVSQSQVAADALRLLVPTIAPITKAMAHLRTSPQRAMAELASHAAIVEEQALAAIREAKRLGAGGRKAPPSSNTGG